MHPLRVFIYSFPYLWRTTRHLIWPLKIQFWLQSYALNKKLYAEHSEWMRREKQGDASLREKCCELRPTERENRSDSFTDSGGNLYVSELSYTKWPQIWPDQPAPAGLRSLRKMVRAG